MKIALLSDAHGNSVGLAACLRQIERRGIEEIYFLGDAVGYLSDPVPVLELLRGAGVACQKGNHEAMLLGELPFDSERDRVYGLAAARTALGDATLDEIAAWPATRELTIDGARLLLSHGSPAPSLTEYVREDTPWEPPPDFAYDAVFLGHTHRPYVRRCGGVDLVNVGSCGLPRDRGDLAAFAVWDGATRSAEILRVRFDVARALELHGDGIHPQVRARFDRRADFNGEIV
jgi:predicted phosphodiesterase